MGYPLGAPCEPFFQVARTGRCSSLATYDSVIFISASYSLPCLFRTLEDRLAASSSGQLSINKSLSALVAGNLSAFWKVFEKKNIYIDIYNCYSDKFIIYTDQN
jgi:hypothetical protein